MSNIKRFVDAQEREYEEAFREISRGKKTSHWMWYIFPQIAGLGSSTTSVFYAINGIDEGVEYLENGYLYNNLVAISEEVLKQENDAITIFGDIDALKLKSSMTLFNYLMRSEEKTNYKKTDVFKRVLDKFYNGEEDERTLTILKSEKVFVKKD